MTDETLFLIDRHEFKGICQSTVRNGRVDFSGHLHNGGGENLTVEEYLKVSPLVEPAVVTWSEMENLNSEFEQRVFLSEPAEEITEEQFIQRLEVLPPSRWVRDGDFERFNMSELTRGMITEQFARLGDRYMRKYVNITKPETWMTRETFMTEAAH